MEFRVLGPLEVLDRGRSIPLASAKQRVLLAALLVPANEVVPSERLIQILWHDTPPADAESSLKGHVSRLRNALEPGRKHGDARKLLLTRPPGYLLSIEPQDVDAVRFDRSIADAQTHVTDDPMTAVRVLDQALALWRGPAFAEFADDGFARSEAIRLNELRKIAIDQRIEALLNLGQCERAAAELERLVVDDPYREHRWELLMLALQRCGRQGDALLAYDRVRALLAEKLDIQPGPALVALEAAILRQEAIASPTPESTTSTAHRTADSSRVRSPRLPTGTVTFLFTDIEGSTQLWEQRPDAMREALARHDARLRDAIDANGGSIVKTTGDGVLAVFGTASEAVAAATEALRALSSEPWDATGPLRIRVGIHTGTADERDGDYFGPALNRASRLMGAAHGGQIVLSHASANAVRDSLPDGLALVDLGEHRLRGLATPQGVYQLTIAGFQAEFPPLQSLDAFPSEVAPAASFAHTDEELAGRRDELARLEMAWIRAGGGERQVALLTGEPGIGKTRLAAELSNRASERDGVALYGRCDEEAIVPYQPFVEALRPIVAAYTPATLHERLHGLEHDLARVFPDLLGQLPEQPRSLPVDTESERYRLFEGITGVVTGVTATRAAVLVLDDLHWANRPTLLLLRHIIRGVQDAALLIVVCYREVELAEDHPLADLVADLGRERFVTRVGLDGLSAAESRDLLTQVAGAEVGSSLSAVLHDETGGNPLFLGELLRHLIETDEVPLEETEGARPIDVTGLDLPAGVRDVVARRLRRLPREVNEVLSVAAVMGMQFDAAVVARALQLPPHDLLQALDHAIDTRLVREDGGRTGRYAFAHALIRQTVYRALRTAQRAQLHASIGTAMEEAGGPGARASALAHHFTEALPLGTAAKAIEYTTKAGHEAIADLAFEDAVAYFERALGFIEQYAPDDRTQRVEVLTDLAEALVNVDERAGVKAAFEAIDAARVSDAGAQLARAVSAIAGSAFALAVHPDDVAALFDEARESLGADHPAVRARLLALEAFEYATYQLQGRDGRALAEAALREARQVDDSDALMAGLFAMACSREGTLDLAERIALGDELIVLGEHAVGMSATAEIYGLRILATAHLEAADIDALDATIAALDRAGDTLRWLPAHAYAGLWRATEALLEGRFDDVRNVGKEMRRYTRTFTGVAGMHGMQLFYLARERGDIGDLSQLEQIVDDHPENFYVSAMLALAQLESGDEAGAREGLDRFLASCDFEQGEKQAGWGAVLALLGEVAANAGTPAQAGALYDLLAPFSGRLLTATMGLACLGAADRYLGMLATLQGRWDDAESHFAGALSTEERVRGWALLPRTGFWYARFHRARDAAGDDDRARAIVQGVIDDSARLGMRRLCNEAERLTD